MRTGAEDDVYVRVGTYRSSPDLTRPDETRLISWKSDKFKSDSILLIAQLV